MGRITSLFGGVLSLLLVSTPVSAWACDMSCSLHQAHSDCRTSATTKDDTGMSMSPDMDMGSDHSESSKMPDTVMSATPGHSMSTSPQQEMATQRFEHATKPKLATGVMHDHSKRLSSCTHETCTQVSASASPPGANYSQPNSLHWVEVSFLSPVNLWVGFRWIRPGTSPPKLLTADRLVTTLRI